MNTKFVAILVVLIYIVLILILTFPSVLYLNNESIGINVVDKYIHFWDFWWAKKSLIDLHKGFYFTDYICYPGGIKIWNANSGFLLSYFTIPLQIIFNNHNVTYNLTVLFSLLFSCLGGYLLASYLFKNRLLGFFVGCILTFNPFVYFNIEHGFLEFVNLGWGFLYLLYLYKMFELKTVKHTLLSCFWFIIAAAWCWYVGYILLLFTGVYFIFNLDYKSILRKPAVFVPKIILWLGIIGSFLFLIYRNIDYGEQKEKIARIDKKFLDNLSQVYSNKKVDLGTLRSNIKRNFYGGWLQIKFESSLDAKSFIYNSKLDWYNPFYFKYWAVLLILSAVALCKSKNRQIIFFIFCFLFFMSLAFGPCFILGQKLLIKTINMTPYSICAYFIPGLERVQFPMRFCIIPILSLAVLAGYGLDVIFNKYGLHQKQKVLLIITMLLLFIFSTQSYYPLPHNPIAVPKIYLKFAQDHTDFAIIEIPFTKSINLLDRLPQKGYKYCYYQTIHNKKRLNGHVPGYIVSRNYPADVRNNYLLNILENLCNKVIQGSKYTINKQKLNQSLNALMKYGYKYILVHKKDLPSQKNYNEIKSILDQALGAPDKDCSTYDEILIYKISSI